MEPLLTAEYGYRAKLAQKKLAVMKAVQFIKKDKTHPFFKYAYVSEEGVLLALRDHMIEAGLVFGFSMDSLKIKDNGTTTGKGKTEYRAEIMCRMWLTDTETGFTEYGQMGGASVDADAKAPWQAVPGCVKYWLCKTFMIATGDDPEAHYEGGPAQKTTKRKTTKRKTTKKKNNAARIMEAARLCGFEKDDVMHVLEQDLGKSNLNDLTEAEVDTFISRMKETAGVE